MTAITIVDSGPSYGIAPPVARQRRANDFLELTKPRMNALVITTTVVGYYLAQHGPCDWWRFAFTLAGTGLTAAGASVLNQLAERDLDALMPRTANRPLATGRIRPIEAWLLGAALSIAGMIMLACFVNLLTALLGAVTLASYLLLYTPAKRRTSLCTIIGAVPGAIPAMMGFTAATGAITPPALALFAILFVWQMPHFLAIAILYRADYARAGFCMLPVADQELDATARQILLYSLALIPTTLMPVLIGTSGWIYCTGALALGAAFCAFGLRLAGSRSRADARQLFLASIVYLPCLLLCMAIDKP